MRPPESEAPRATDLLGRTARWFGSLVDRCIAPTIVANRGEPLRRLRIAVSLLLLNAVAAPGGIAFQFTVGEVADGLVSTTIWLATVIAIFMARRGIEPHLLGHLLGFIATVPILLSASRTGLFLNPPTSLLVAPVLVVLVAGGRAGLWWCLVSIGGYAYLASHTTEFEEHALAQQWAVSLSLATAMLTLLVYVSDQLRVRAQRKLAEARDEARVAAETQSRFVANISHEIRTPMNGLLGLLDHVLDTELRRPQREHLQIAQSSGRSLLGLLNDVLDMSKLQAGRMSLSSAPMDLRTLGQEVLEQAAIGAGHKGVELLLDYPPELPTRVVGDVKRVRQVLVNLVNNAVKFTEQGHVRVGVRLAAEDRADDPRSGKSPVRRFECSVEDTGIGIPPGLEGMVFEQFEQADSSLARVHTGTGLGLTIVRELVELMRGTIAVRTRHGEGSTFTFTVPLVLAEPPTPPPPPLREATALVVCPYPPLCRLLCEQLEYLGMTVRSCDGASEALDLLRSARDHPIAVTLVDHRPALLDGEALADAIAADDDLRTTPILMLPLRHALAAGMVPAARPGASKDRTAREAPLRLSRPVRWSSLLDALERALRDEVSDDPVAETIPSSSSEETTTQSLRVLVVEDNVINQKVVSLMLTTAGHQVDTASSGAQALQMLEDTSYELVLMDIQMPGMDGIETTRRLRDQEAPGSRVPVVALTAHAMSEDRARCIDGGMDGYLTKPLQREELFEVIASLTSVT